VQGENAAGAPLPAASLAGKVKGIRFETLDRICSALECQPGDILEWRGGTENAAK
jgi:DNA-binding Xre family transcriptional regulator